MGVATAGSCPVVVIASGFTAPYGIAFDAAMNMYVSDSALNAVVQIPPGAAGAF
jgi:hypothetical protein